MELTMKRSAKIGWKSYKNTLFNLILALLIATVVLGTLFISRGDLRNHGSSFGRKHTIEIDGSYDDSSLILTNRSDCPFGLCQIQFVAKYEDPKRESAGKRLIYKWAINETLQI